jgi:hypothetical protein
MADSRGNLAVAPLPQQVANDAMPMARHVSTEHDTMAMTGGTTGPQLAAVTLLTLLALGAGVVLSGLSGGLTMGPTMATMPMPHASDGAR